MKDTLIQNLITNSLISEHALGFEPEIEVPYKWDIVSRFKKQGVNHLSLSIATDMTNVTATMKMITKTQQYIQQHDDYVLVNRVDDIQNAKSRNKMAISFMFQGSNPIDKNLDMIDIYYQLGVKSLIIAYNIQNSYGGGCTDKNDNGLTRFGYQLIEKMNQTGMIIDLSHVGIRTSLDAISHSQQPVIFSHVNIGAIHPHPRNITDEQIIACAAGGGFVGIGGNGPLLGDLDAKISTYVDHIDYVVQLVGEDHVALGTDHVYFQEVFDNFMQKNSVVYPQHYDVPQLNQWHSITPEQLPEIVAEMKKRHYSEDRIKKILGGNFMRVAKAVLK